MINRGAFKPVFRQFVLLCRKLELFGGELLAVDETRLKAVNSTARNFTHAKLTKQIDSIDEKLTNYLQRLDRCDAQEAEPSTRIILAFLLHPTLVAIIDCKPEDACGVPLCYILIP
jgi:hypothetical protein